LANGEITYAHVALVCIRADFSNERSGSGLGKLGDGLLVKLLLKGVLALVERLVQDNGRLLDALSLCGSGIVDGTEDVVVSQGLGKTTEGFIRCLVISTEESYENDIV
jgi:hypothetical protein